MTSALIFLDGVLRRDSSVPIPSGIALFRALQGIRRTVILVKDKEAAEVWLLQNKIIQVDDLVSYDDAKVDSAVDLVEFCRSRGPLEVVVTDDPDVAKELLERGITSLLFLHPKYIRPEFRPDGRKGIRSWDDLQSEIVKQEDLYREDHRV